MQTQIIHGMAAKDYHLDEGGPRLSQSLATLIIKETPAHARQASYALGADRGDYTASDDHGTITHALMLEPENQKLIHEISATDKDGEIVTNYRTKAAQEEKETAEARGQIPMTRDKLDIFRYKAKALSYRLKSHETNPIELDGRSEVVIYWEEQTSEGPVRCRCRIDHLRMLDGEIQVIDLKTTDSAAPKNIQRVAWDKGYEIQDAAYRRAVEAKFPDFAGRVTVVFAFLELAKPYVVNPVTFSARFRRLGEARWERACNIWARCLKEDHWPAYAGGELDPPHWAETEDMGNELA